MTEFTQNIALNIYEPEANLKYFKKPKKSIITKIIKNPEIGPVKKKIKIKYNDINEYSLNLIEYNSFRRPGEKIFRAVQKNEEKKLNKNGNNNNLNNKNYLKNKNQDFVINRKQLEKLHKNIPNNLYDYLHPYEYRFYSKNNTILKNYLKMRANPQKELEEKKKPKNKEVKILKLTDDLEFNNDFKLTRYKSNNLVPLRSNLKSASNDKFFLSKSTKYNKTLSSNINILKEMLSINNINIKNKSKNKIKEKKIKKLKSKQIYENISDDYSSNESFTENINNSKLHTETNFKKRLFINGNEICSFNKFLYYNTLSSKNLKTKKSYLTKPKIKMIPYNQKIFNRNNAILVPYDEMKKLVFNSDESNSQKKWKNYKNIFGFTKNIDKIYDTNKKAKIIKDVEDLHGSLNELKFYIISDKIDREKYNHKLDELEKKMNYREDKMMIVKDILFEKLNNSENQNDYINHAVNKNQYVNKLISSYVNFNEKKSEGLLDKKFMGGLKKLNVFGMQDAIIRNVIGENNYVMKHSINKIEEVEIAKDRKNIGDNMKRIKQMIKIINKKKKNLGQENK